MPLPVALGLLTVLPLVALATFVYLTEERRDEAVIRSQLEELASVREEWVQDHVRTLGTRAELVSSRTRLREDLAARIDGGDAGLIPGIEGILADALQADQGLVGIALVGPQGDRVTGVGAVGAPTVAATTPGDRPALVRLDSLAAPPGVAEVLVAPLVLEGRRLGALELWFSGEELLRIAADSLGLGNSGEVLLGVQDADGTVRFVGPVRFGASAPLVPVNVVGSTLPVEQAIDGEESFLDAGIDYRGVPVLAATRHIDPTGWGLVVKMDRDEARAGLTALQGRLLAGTLGLGAIIVLLTLLGARWLRRSEESLQSANLRLQRTLEANPFPALLYADDGEVLLASDSWLERTGYRRDEAMDLHAWSRILHDEEGEEPGLFEVFGEAPEPVEGGLLRFRSRAGEELIWGVRSIPLGPLPDGRRTALTMAVDVTERTRLVEELRRTLSQLHATLQATPLPFWRLDVEGRVEYCNSAAERTFGWSLEEVRGQALPVVPRRYMEEFRGHLEHLTSGRPFPSVETVRRKRSGEEIPVLIHAGAIGDSGEGPVGIVVIYEDLSEERHKERELQRLNRALGFVSGANAALVRSRGREDLLDEVCRVALERGGYAHVWIAFRQGADDALELHQQSRNGSLDLFSYPDLRDEIDAATSVGVATVTRGLTRGERAWEKDLAGRGYRALAVLPFPRNGEMHGFLAVSHEDGDALDEAEVAVLKELTTDLAYGLHVAAIRRELFLINQAVESLTLGVTILAAEPPDYPVVLVNQGFTAITGYAPSEVTGRAYTLLRGPESDPGALAEIDAALEEQRSTQVTLLNYRKSGEEFWNRVTLEPIRTPGGRVTHFVVIEEDVTEQREIGRELEHRARLSAVGELAGGVAHDFRNILTASQGILQLSLSETELSDDARERLSELKALVSRGSAVTERLLALSRRGPREARPKRLDAILQEFAAILPHTLRDDIVVHFEVAGEEAPLVRIDADQFTTVLLNLARNAAQAMPGGGVLSLIRDEPVEPADPTWWPPDLEPDSPRPWVRVRVQDTGVGMDAETLAQAFDPYFTTKPAGEGTGLGLPAAYGVIEGMGGRIWLASQVGEGTTVHILLPTLDPSEAEVADAEVARHELARAPARPSTILLAEDDTSVLRVFKRALERQGHTVLTGEDGAEALEAYRRGGGRVDLLITDGVMPHMSGAELAKAVWKEQPDLPVVVTSGFGSEDLRAEFPEEPPAPLVFRPKPLSLDALVDTVNEFLSLQDPEAP